MPQIESEVIETDAQTPVVPAKDSGKEDNVTMTRAEADGLRRERDEARESERYWASAARSNRPAAEPEPEEVDNRAFLDDDAPDGIQDDTAEKLVNDLASKGVAGLKERGFITAKDAQKLASDVAIKVARQLIGEQSQRTSSDAAIMSAYPELRDQTSELFKATAKIYQEAVAMDPSVKKTPAGLFLAAKAAKASLKPAPKARDEEEDDRYERPERESDRRARADSQDGRTRGRGDVDRGDDMLGPEVRDICKSMGITEEEWTASNKQLSGGRGRRK